jgi:TRAP-type mannitol/chloroaromatic compound transport system permease small subunit
MTSALRFARSMGRINDATGVTLRWLAVVMVLLGAYNALARYFTRQFGVPLSSNALNEAQWYLFTLIFLLGSAYALRHDVHIRVDVFYARLSARRKAWTDIAGTILFLIPFCVLMLWVAWSPVRISWAIREVSPDPGGLPRYPIKAVILLSFALLLLQGIAFIIERVAIVRGELPAAAVDPKPDEPDVRHGEGL